MSSLFWPCVTSSKEALAFGIDSFCCLANHKAEAQIVRLVCEAGY